MNNGNPTYFMRHGERERAGRIKESIQRIEFLKIYSFLESNSGFLMVGNAGYARALSMKC